MKVTALVSNQVQVWHGPLSLLTPKLEYYRTIISTYERERAARYVTETLSTNYICARGMLRELLGIYLQQNPTQLVFTKGEKNKPYVECDDAQPQIYFNLTHTNHYLAYAFSISSEVGIDVEENERQVDYLEIAKRFFTRQESEALHAQPKDAQRHYFFKLWVRKEAYLKAIGLGLAHGLDAFSVIGSQVDDPAFGVWKLHQLELPDPYLGCVACRPDIMDMQIAAIQ